MPTSASIFTGWTQDVHRISLIERLSDAYSANLSMQVEQVQHTIPEMAASMPLHRRLADALRDEIAQGSYPRGTRLPSEHELAAQHGVARGTVRQALATLRAEGSIAIRQGAWPVVLGRARTQSFSELQSFTSWARGLGEQPTGRVVELGLRRPTADEALALGLADGDEVLAVLRVRMLGGRPVMVERTAFVAELAPIVATAELERGSIYEHLAGHGVRIAQARHAIDALAASSVDARLLGVPRRAALLRDRRLGLSPEGTPVEWSDDRYRPDVVTFGVDNAAASSPLTRHSTREQEAADVDRRQP
jgi:GntR family transcriptional regulator